jgi:hypothetical protein
MRDNFLTGLESDFVAWIEESTNLTTVTLDDCPIDCGCSQLYFQRWVQTTEKILFDSIENLQCNTPLTLAREYVINYEQDTFQCYVKQPLIIIVCVLVAIAVSVLVYKYSWYIRHIRIVGRAVVENLRSIKQEHNCEYDAYVSYNREDEKDSDWVANHLIPTIEEKQLDSAKVG